VNWSDERYVRLYTRDTPDWQCLSFLAQGLFCLILRKVDRAGVLPLGRSGRKAVAIAVGHAHQWALLEPALEELLSDGCIRIEGDLLVVPNFLDAQEAEASDKARSKVYRERRRDLAKAGRKDGREPDGGASRGVTAEAREVESRDASDTRRDGTITACAATVTPSRAVPSRAVLLLEACAEVGEKTAHSPPPVLTLPCVGTDAKEYPVSEAEVAGWREAFPGVEVVAEIRKAKAWLLADPVRRKTYRGMPRFLVGWLSRTQNAPSRLNGTAAPRPVTPQRLPPLGPPGPR
jgi:hypothetical protein